MMRRWRPRRQCNRCALSGVAVRPVIWAAGTLSEMLCQRCELVTRGERRPADPVTGVA